MKRSLDCDLNLFRSSEVRNCESLIIMKEHFVNILQGQWQAQGIMNPFLVVHDVLYDKDNIETNNKFKRIETKRNLILDQPN